MRTQSMLNNQPRVLVCCCEATKIFFKTFVDYLRLTVGFWVVGCATQQGGVVQVKEFLPKLTHEDVVLSETIEAGNEDSGNRECGEGVF